RRVIVIQEEQRSDGILQGTRHTCTFAFLIGIFLSMLAGVAVAQQPVAAMFSDGQKRDASLALSFLTVDLPATKGAGFPVHVYLSAGDLERAFDRPEFRPDAAIVPTNTDLLMTASARPRSASWSIVSKSRLK